VGYGVYVSLPSDRRQRRSSAYDGPLFDEIDRRILVELQDDGRVTMAELGRRVNLSAPAVGERVQRLEESGVITGYSAVVEPRAIGYPIAAIVRIRPARRQLHKVPEVARSTPEVVECHRVTGEDCYIARLHLRSMDDLEGILDRFAVVGQTTTSIVHSAPVAHRPLPVPDPSDGA
jgi:Lrp/AsnC family transcriptional regulator, leucine-responsive regulatory protein